MITTQHGKSFSLCSSLRRLSSEVTSLGKSLLCCLTSGALYCCCCYHLFSIRFRVHSCRFERSRYYCPTRDHERSGHISRSLSVYKIWTCIIDCWWFVVHVVLRPCRALSRAHLQFYCLCSSCFLQLYCLYVYLCVDRRLLMPFMRERTCARLCV